MQDALFCDKRCAFSGIRRSQAEQALCLGRQRPHIYAFGQLRFVGQQAAENFQNVSGGNDMVRDDIPLFKAKGGKGGVGPVIEIG